MTLRSKLVAAVLASTLGYPTGVISTPYDVREAEACLISLQALQSALSPDRPWRLTQDAPNHTASWRSEQIVLQSFPSDAPNDDGWGWFATDPETDLPAKAEGPSASMARAFVASTPVNGMSCKAVRDLASMHKALPSWWDRRSARVGPDGLYRRSYLTLEKAVLSPDGTEALVYVAGYRGPLAGGGYLVLFRKQPDAMWQEAARMGVWVS